MLNIPRSEFINKLRKYADDFKLNGVLRVTIQGRIDLEECFGYADINTKEAIKPDSVFAFYSLSKPFCAIGMHLLKQNGSIDLDKHPSTYVPELKGLHNGVTIRKMLHHNSGIPDISPSMADTSLKAPSLVLRSALNNLCKQDMQFTPGEGYNYINANFSLCALIAENVTGMAYGDFIRQEVLEPLGAKTARVYDDLNPRADMVNGMELLDGKLIHVPVGTFGMLGAGDISGTVDDVYRLNIAIKNRLLLNSSEWDDILTPSPLGGMGHGCFAGYWHDKFRITHNGGHVGFRTIHIQLPEDDFDIILLSNSGWGNARFELADMIYDEYYGKANGRTDTMNLDGKYIDK